LPYLAENRWKKRSVFRIGYYFVLTKRTVMQNQLPLDTQLLKKAALVFRAINHPLRKEMLRLLHRRERISVTGIYTELRLAQSVASQHLAILRKARLARTEREGKKVYYGVDYERLAMLHKAARLLAETSDVKAPANRKKIAVLNS
jgi:DNA-binding transcriptional ArsR family regulator